MAAASCASANPLALASRGGSVPSRSQPPLRLVHVSDIHAGLSAGQGDPASSMPPIYRELLRRADKLAPDLILVTGDIVSGKDGLALAGAIMDGLATIAPVYAVMGNHDYSLGPDAMKDFLSRHGCTLLVNEWAVLKKGDRSVSIYGADDLLRGAFAAPSLADAGSGDLVLACHEPAFVDLLDPAIFARPRTYAFSGHTHGGQITFFGAPLYLPEGSGGYPGGEYRIGELILRVSRGVGTSRIDLRVFAPPDICWMDF